ncbi:hypothetical protein PPACK8108_LOCUS23551 [Phakopsora pachyrhizi]|uniref:Uncharacterized protein n=1 Tax=Phakopsora pachyrhizi TaxID=170000 RepID=A0AAV0BR94_PHAPC|nr:hypothetical protein PPACK8108_LOCUS23551 [Phakopsora pachyrhizi]
MNRDLVHKSASNRNRNKEIQQSGPIIITEVFKDLKTAYLNGLDELGFSLLKASFLLFSFNPKCFLPYEVSFREMCYLKAQARQNKYCTNQAWETDRISRAPQTLNAECFYASVEGIDEFGSRLNEPCLAIPVDSSKLNNNFNQQLHHQQMNYKLHGPRGPRPDLRKDMNKANTDAAHNAAYLGESTPPIETFIKLSSLTKLKKSLRSKSQQRMYFAYRLSSNQLKISDPIPLTSAFQAIRSRARLKYTLDDKNEDGDEVIEDIREAAKPFHLGKGSNTIVNVLAHLREDLRMAMRTGEMGSLVSAMRKEGSLEWDSRDSGWAGPTASAGYLIMEGLADTLLEGFWKGLKAMNSLNKGFRGLRQDKDSTKIKGQKSRRYRIKRLRTIRKKSRAVEQDRKAENSGKESIGVKKSPTKARSFISLNNKSIIKE